MSNDKHKDFEKENGSVYTAIGNLLSTIPGGVIQFELSDRCRILLVTDKMLEIVGCNRKEFLNKYKDDIYNLVYDQDKEMVMEGICERFHNRLSLDFECRIITFDDTIKWVAVNIQVLNNSDSGLQAYAVVVDIDNYKRSQIQLSQEKDLLEQEKDKYKKILNLNSDIFFEYDVKSDLIAFNNADINFQSSNGNIGDFSKKILHTGKIHENDKEKILELKKMKDKADVEFRFMSVDGSFAWCQIKAIAVNDDNGNVTSIIGWVNNIDKEKREKEYLQEKNKRDPLTRIYNRSFVEKSISEYLMDQGQDGIHALLIMDIDNFRSVNEHLGDIFGDAVLVNIADNLQNTFYKSDVVGRIGGDEFLVFIKNVTNMNLLVEKLDEIKDAVQNTYVGEDLENQISCSIGISLFPEDGENFENLFRHADTALYYAKVLGKNRYEFFEDVVEENLPDCTEELFHVYKVDAVKKQGFNSFNRKITTFAFDIMARTKDVNSAINLILDKVGKQFDATFVNIVEVQPSHKAQMTYDWTCNGGRKRRENVSFTADDTFLEGYSQNFDEHGVFSIDDTTKLKKDFELMWLVEKYGVKSLIQCAIVENGKLAGCVTIIDSQKTREWNKNETESLITITKVIASYLLKMRTSQMMEERLNEVKNFDSLTKLPTLFKFKNDTREILVNNLKKQYVIINVDFQRFKYINDTYGYDRGDQILKDFAEMLTSYRIYNLVNCRVTSDNFLILMEYEGEQETIRRVQELAETFLQIQKEKSLNFNLKLVSGACMVESNFGDIMVPIDNANLARKYAKENGKDYCYFFDREMRERIRNEFEITNNMEKALAHKEFKVFLQPKVYLADGSLAGAEALVRWVRPDQGILPPDKFIPLFEKNGFVVNLDFFVYEEVCKMLCKWIDTGKKAIPVSVNVSRVHLYDEGFVDQFIELTQSYGIPNQLIELELTESIFLDNTEVAIATMRRLRSLGFKVSIDDFGAGYSSLNLLKDMTSDVIKLDKGFFGSGELQQEERIIVSSIVNMAKQLNMKVLSEGVETLSQSQFLKDIDCDLAQGYLFAKPMPLANFELLMDNDSPFAM